MRLVFSILVFVFLLTSCKVDPEVKMQLPSSDVVEVIPENWPLPAYTFSTNILSENAFKLGRALFYEPMLSADNTISCGSCHQRGVAFAHAGHNLSHGINDLTGTRNSPGLFNLNWHPYFMHDGGVNHIEVQPLAPITNTVEMAEALPNVITKLKSSVKYQQLFRNAFGEDEITGERMMKAMAQFMGMMYSYKSKYDFVKQGKDKFSEQELKGYELFKAKCNNCHTEPLFSDFKFRNNGLSIHPVFKDTGRAHITSLKEDRFKFKTPSLRNVEVTWPYMHDGRYETLNECLNFYSGSIRNQENLDPLLQNGIQLSAEEKTQLIEFLKTLTDYNFINDKRFDDPN